MKWIALLSDMHTPVPSAAQDRTPGRWCLLLVLGVLGIGAATAQDKNSPPKLELSKDEQAILDETNAVREKNKLLALKPNHVLFRAARDHSANMAKQGKMEHNLDGKSPADRLTALGYRYQYMGENIAAGEGWMPAGVVAGWMDSQGHRENILKREFREIGIGIARGKDGTLYYTQVFGTPLKVRP
jgi:uncharacterized protein YkwD